MTEHDLMDRVLARLQPAPFWDHLGAALASAEHGRATVRLAARAEFGRSANTGDGTVHGGVVSSLIDMTASCAVITTLAEGEGRTTVDLTVHFLAPARGELEATATVRRRGGRTAVIDVEVTDEGGGLVALGRSTFAILPARA